MTGILGLDRLGSYNLGTVENVIIEPISWQEAFRNITWTEEARMPTWIEETRNLTWSAPDMAALTKRTAEVRLYTMDLSALPEIVGGDTVASVTSVITNRNATILYVEGDWTYTREKPWHGRSGGGLFDLDGKVLIGVVNGYETISRERGIYVSHSAVVRFLTKWQAGIQQIPATPPEPVQNYKYSTPQQRYQYQYQPPQSFYQSPIMQQCPS